MVGNDFLYNGHWLSEYGMKVYDPEDSQQFVGREIEKANITSLRPVPNHYTTHYTNVLTLSFLVIKDDEYSYLSQDEMKMSGEEINMIRAWIESPKTPIELFCPNDDDIISTHYFGLFTDTQPFIVRQECYGLYLTFTCNAPYGFSDIVSKTYEFQSEDTISGFFANYSSERNEYLKPKIVIQSSSSFGADETLKIQNVSDDNKFMLITMPTGVSSITIDCQKKSIIDNNGNILSLSDIGLTLPISDDYNYISTELYSFYWLRLLPDRNNLSFTRSEDSSIQSVIISGRYIIKSGGF